MSSKEIVVHKDKGAPTLWDPWSGLGPAARFSELFEDFFGTFPTSARGTMPKANIQETDKEYVITAALPGVRKEEIKIAVEDGVLTVSGEHREEKEEKGKGFLRQEMSCGMFTRSFILPIGVHPEDVRAAYKDGLLTVRLPKTEPPKGRGVSVKVE